MQGESAIRQKDVENIFFKIIILEPFLLFFVLFFIHQRKKSVLVC